MPTYQYACTACGHRFEAVQSFSDASLTDCPECAGRLRKVFSSVGIVFKGSGFYRTDSRAGSSDGPVKEPRRRCRPTRRRRAAPATPRVPPRRTRRRRSPTPDRRRPRRRPRLVVDHAAHPPRPRPPDALPAGGCPHRRRLSTGSANTARRSARRPNVGSDDRGTTDGPRTTAPQASGPARANARHAAHPRLAPHAAVAAHGGPAPRGAGARTRTPARRRHLPQRRRRGRARSPVGHRAHACRPHPGLLAR